MKIRAKEIIFEDFVNYKKPSLFIATGTCDWKCCKEQNINCSICHNSALAKQTDFVAGFSLLLSMYNDNHITKSIVFGGLEPFTNYDELIKLIQFFRNHKVLDDVVIYTGYNKNEIYEHIKILQSFKNIIIKYGRYVVDSDKRYDPVLGVHLASANQYAEKIS